MLVYVVTGYAANGQGLAGNDGNSKLPSCQAPAKLTGPTKSYFCNIWHSFTGLTVLYQFIYIDVSFFL